MFDKVILICYSLPEVVSGAFFSWERPVFVWKVLEVFFKVYSPLVIEPL